MPKKKKHPREMTSDELIRHLFHPRIIKHVKGILKEHNVQSVRKKATKKH